MSSPSGDPPECRICRDSTPPLLKPCLCASHAHQACLRQWVASRTSSLFPLTFSPSAPSCEVCRSPYLPIFSSPAPPSHKPVATSTNSPIPHRHHHHLPDPPHPQPFPARILSCLCPSAPDPLSLQPRGAVCDAVVSLECCMLLCLFVLAVSGHTIFVIHMYAASSAAAAAAAAAASASASASAAAAAAAPSRVAAQDDYARERLLLAVLNALLTFSLLALVRKIVVRWLRETASFESAVGAAAAAGAAFVGGSGGVGSSSNSSSCSTGGSAVIGAGAGAGHGGASASTSGTALSVMAADTPDGAVGGGGGGHTVLTTSAAGVRNPLHWRNVAQLTLGACLSMCAGAELFLLVSALR